MACNLEVDGLSRQLLAVDTSDEGRRRKKKKKQKKKKEEERRSKANAKQKQSKMHKWSNGCRSDTRLRAAAPTLKR